ncbi:UDP-2,4-diacetamido-2,4,6-trideoxy-beta-L-altropyranose hydrolase [Thaumasiovibrio subtropicus]|uniref:UDP-2,4-diacetamido-2,4, 6-trideoxy-beta-L-altropyranose hydrolase n=1 Tax=Thaumasiovibrio subtropicus TaxID=1891207 RepID=UPI000B353B26|nr:UDP-2,4-diacetamido-2,4,6-trideoxy-beta-L-altropyranose hydrolase [Thaumasiovibrio subtropicus]
MNIVVRADSGIEIGTGHIMRCITLSKALRDKGHHIIFVCKAHEGNIVKLIEEIGITVFTLPLSQPSDEGLDHSRWLGGTLQKDAEMTAELSEEFFGAAANLIIVDHYGIDARWHTAIKARSSQTKIFVIDDLADRDLECDYLLDQTFMRSEIDYHSRVPANCQLLLGTQYALLRPEFSEHSVSAKEKRALGIEKTAKRVLVMMGGTDHLNMTEKVLNAIQDDKSIIKLTVVLGPTAPYRSAIEKTFGKDSRVEFLAGVSNIAELMLEHDVCFGAAGAASWERCAMGLPSLLVAFASNQTTILSMLGDFGAISIFGVSDTPEQIKEQLNQICMPEQYSKMVESCFKVSDGLGTQRVLGVLTQ